MTKLKIYVPSDRPKTGLFNRAMVLGAAKEQYDRGFTIAAVDALFFCWETDSVVPDWVKASFLESLYEALGYGKYKSKGSKARPSERLKFDIRHYHRYDAVTRAKGTGIKGDKTYSYAKALLKGTTSYASIPSIKKSYLLVRKAICSPGGKARFRYPASRYVQDLIWNHGKTFGADKG